MRTAKATLFRLIHASFCQLGLFIIPDLNLVSFFFFNDTATTEIYTLSLHDALPIFFVQPWTIRSTDGVARLRRSSGRRKRKDRKSTRLNSSHTVISYAVFCLKKKKKNNHPASLCTIHLSQTKT